MLQRAFIILLMFKLYSVITGLPSPNSPRLPSPMWPTAPIINPSSTSTSIPTAQSNGTIAVSSPATTKSTYPTLMTTSPSYAMASSSPNSTSKSQNQSGWSPGDVGTILFGCIGTALAVLTLWLTFWLGRQRFKFIINEEFQKQLQLENLP